MLGPHVAVAVGIFYGSRRTCRLRHGNKPGLLKTASDGFDITKLISTD